MLKRNANALGFLAAFFLTGSIVNDATLLGDESFLTWAKLFFVIGLILALSDGLKRKKPSHPELIVYLYSLILPVMSLISGYGFSGKSLSVSASLLIGGFSFYSLLRIRVEPKVLVKAFLIWVAISVFLGIIQALTGRMFIGDRIFESGLIPSTYRASGLMNDPNYFSLICLIGLALSFLTGISKLHFYLCVTGILLAGSRAGILSLIITLVAIKTKGEISIKFLVHLFGAVLLLLILLYAFQEYLPGNFAMIFDATNYEDSASRNSLQDRFIAISAAIDAFKEFPFFGYGLGNFIYYPSNLHNQVSHNTYVEMLAEIGIAGFAIHLLMLYSIFFKGSKFDKFEGNINKTKSAILVLIAFCIMSTTLVTYYSRLLFFTLSIGYILLQNQREKAPANN